MKNAFKYLVLTLLLCLSSLLFACDKTEEQNQITKLDTPIVVVSETGLATWEAVENATGYRYILDESFSFMTSNVSVQLNDGQTISVMALGDNVDYSNSDFSETVKYEKPLDPTTEDKVTEDETTSSEPTEEEPTTDEPTNEQTLADKYDCITIEKAIEIANAAGSTETTERYYIYGIVKQIKSEQYGEMIITNGTTDLLVYGTYSADGSKRYSELEEKPVVGDEVVLYGNLLVYSGTPEVKSGWIIEFVKAEGEDQPTEDDNAPENNPIVPEGEGIWSEYELVSIEYANYLATKAGENGTTERYYVYGTVKTISNPSYGEMTITDGTNELYVYGTYSADGVNRYSELAEKPVAGDEVVLSVLLSTHNGNPQAKSGWIIQFNHKAPEIDLTEYKTATISEAREALEGEKLLVTGIVAQITYAEGKVPSGVYLVDNGNSIYVYGNDIAGQVVIGNEITVAATKDYYVLDKEQDAALKQGYEGCNQLSSAFLIENDKEVNELTLDWVKETTVKTIMETSVEDNITTTIYKVTALITRDEPSNFVNYYINDLDGVTGTYVYTQCSGADFAWLDKFDGKFCTVYLSVINYKSTSSGCVARLLPIVVKDEGYQFDINEACEYALTYHAVDQFESVYNSDPKLELVTSVKNELLGITVPVEFTYTSSNENLVYFEETEDGVIMHTNKPGKAVVTITAKHGEATATKEVEINVELPPNFEYIGVAAANSAAVGDEVVVKGIIAGSLINKFGFYLIDNDAIISVVVKDSSVLKTLKVGDEVIISGKRDLSGVKEGFIGHIFIADAEIIVNLYGEHEIPTQNFITGKTVEEVYAVSYLEQHSNEVYVLNATIKYYEVQQGSYVNKSYKVGGTEKELTLYSGNAGQYAWLDEFVDKEAEVTLALCNWNSKKYYATCIISIKVDGETVYNTYNFN